MSLQLTHKQHYASNAWTFVATSPPQQPRPSHTSSTSTHNGSFKKPKRTMRHIQCRRGYFAYVDPAVTKTTYFDGAQIGGCFQPKSHSSFWAKLTVSGWKTIPGYTGFFLAQHPASMISHGLGPGITPCWSGASRTCTGKPKRTQGPNCWSRVKMTWDRKNWKLLGIQPTIWDE